MKLPFRSNGNSARTRRAVLAVPVLLLLTALPSFGLTVQFKLSGGYGLLALDDVNRSLGGWEDLVKKHAAATPGWSYEAGEAGRIRSGFDIEGEFLLGLTPRWAVGIGSGFMVGEAAERATSLDILRSSVPYVYARPTNVTATPLVLSGYHFFPLGRKFAVYAGVGAGWVRVRYSDREAVKKKASAGFTYSNEQSATGHGTLVHGVAGIKYAHDENLGLFLEADWKRARVKDLGNGAGTLFFYEEYHQDLDFWQARMSVLDEPPTGETFRSVRKAVVDCSGFALKLGFFVKF